MGIERTQGLQQQPAVDLTSFRKTVEEDKIKLFGSQTNPNIKLSNKTIAALSDPEPGSYMYNLNKLAGLVEFKA